MTRRMVTPDVAGMSEIDTGLPLTVGSWPIPATIPFNSMSYWQTDVPRGGAS